MVVLVHAIRVCRGAEVVPLIPRIDDKWNGVVNFKPRQFYPRKKSRFLLNRKMCGTQSQDGVGRVEKKLFFSRIQNPGCQARSPVTLPTTVYEFQMKILQNPTGYIAAITLNKKQH